MNLKDKLLKNSTSKYTAVIEDSKVWNTNTFTSVPIPMLNVAFSGDLNGGFSSGIHTWAGKSKHFKSLFLMIQAKAYMDKYPESMFLFYDTEFGTPAAYFTALGFDMSRVIHTPITDAEEFTQDIMQQLQGPDGKGGIERGERLFIGLDSLGNMASRREVNNALSGNDKDDMSRQKKLKSTFRMITPHLSLKDVPMAVIAHTYDSMDLYSQQIVSGGQGIYLSSDNIYVLGRQQQKDGTELEGYNFIINVEKSRHVKEKSKIPITVTFEGGINKYSGLLDVALAGQFVAKPKNGWYCKVDQETGELSDKNFRLKDTNTKEFWDPILNSEKFKDYITNRYKVSAGNLITTREDDPYLEEHLIK